MAGAVGYQSATGTAVKRPAIDVKHVDLPKGTLFTRRAMAIATGKGSISDSVAYAKRWTDTPEVARSVKMALEGTAVIGSPAWGGELVNPDTALFLKGTGNPHLAKPFKLDNVKAVVAQVLQAKS